MRQKPGDHLHDAFCLSARVRRPFAYRRSTFDKVRLMGSIRISSLTLREKLGKGFAPSDELCLEVFAKRGGQRRWEMISRSQSLQRRGPRWWRCFARERRSAPSASRAHSSRTATKQRAISPMLNSICERVPSRSGCSSEVAHLPQSCCCIRRVSSTSPGSSVASMRARSLFPRTHR